MANNALEFLRKLFPDKNLVIGQAIAQQLDAKIIELVNLMRTKGIENLVAAEMEYNPKVVKKLSEEEIIQQQNLIIDHFSTHINIFFPTGLKDTNTFSNYVRTFSQVDIATYWILYGTEAGKYLNPKFGGRVLKEEMYKIYETNNEKIAWEDNKGVIELTMIPVSPEKFSENYLAIQNAVEEVGKRFGVYFGNPRVQLNRSTTMNGENIDDPYSQQYDGIGTYLAISMCKVGVEISPFLMPKYLFNEDSIFSIGPTRINSIKQHYERTELRANSENVFQKHPSLLVLLSVIVPLIACLNSKSKFLIAASYAKVSTNNNNDEIFKRKLMVEYNNEESKIFGYLFEVLR